MKVNLFVVQRNNSNIDDEKVLCQVAREAINPSMLATYDIS